MRMSEKCRIINKHDNNNSDNPMISRRYDQKVCLACDSESIRVFYQLLIICDL